MKKHYSQLKPSFAFFRQPWHHQHLRHQCLHLLRHIQCSESNEFIRSVPMAKNATGANNVEDPAFASTTRGAKTARLVVGPAYVNTTRNATNAQSAKTYHAHLKAAHNLGIASANPLDYYTTCAPSIVVSPRHLQKPRS